MNVDAAVKGVRVLGFKTTQPNDPRDHRIASGSIRLENFAGKPAIVKDRADRRVIANLFARPCRKPSGVVILPQKSPTPNFDVETG